MYHRHGLLLLYLYVNQVMSRFTTACIATYTVSREVSVTIYLGNEKVTIGPKMGTGSVLLQGSKPIDAPCGCGGTYSILGAANASIETLCIDLS